MPRGCVRPFRPGAADPGCNCWINRIVLDVATPRSSLPLVRARYGAHATGRTPQYRVNVCSRSLNSTSRVVASWCLTRARALSSSSSPGKPPKCRNAPSYLLATRIAAYAERPAHTPAASSGASPQTDAPSPVGPRSRPGARRSRSAADGQAVYQTEPSPESPPRTRAAHATPLAHPCAGSPPRQARTQTLDKQLPHCAMPPEPLNQPVRVTRKNAGTRWHPARQTATTPVKPRRSGPTSCAS